MTWNCAGTCVDGRLNGDGVVGKTISGGTEVGDAEGDGRRVGGNRKFDSG